MSELFADLRDTRFILFEQLLVQELAKHPRYADYNKETLDAILVEGVKFAQQVISPINDEGDKIGCKFEGGKVYMPESGRAALKAWGENGWAGLMENPEFGGQGAPLVLGSAVDEYMVAANTGLSLTPMLTVGAAHLIEEFGQEWMKAVCLERMYSLKWMGTMCLTEPQAGSDVGASRTKAIAMGDGRYKITGVKNFISSGDQQFSENILHMVMARADNAPPGTKGLSLFMVPKMRFDDKGRITEPNDVQVASIEHKMGIHGSPTCTLNFGDNEDCYGWLIGEIHGGMALMFNMMNEARIYVGMQGVALGAVSYQKALRYTRERLQGPNPRNMRDPEAPKVPIVMHSDIRRGLMEMKSWTEGLRSLNLTVAWYQDMARTTENKADADRYKGYVELLTPVCKAYGSDIGFEMTIEAMQLMGGYGYCHDYDVEQYARDAKIASIYEGTNGIQALDLIGRKLGMAGGQLFMNYVFAMNNFLAAQKPKHPEFEAIFKALDDGKMRLAKLTLKLGGIVKADVEGGLQHAVTYLRMFGHVACMFELAKQAVVASEALAKLCAEKGIEPEGIKTLILDHADARYYNGKVLSAKFFAANIMPEVEAMERRITSGDRSAIDHPFEIA